MITPGQFVGFPCRVICHVGSSPDMVMVRGVNHLRFACRVCRVLSVGESSREIGPARLPTSIARTVTSLTLLGELE